MNLAEMSFVEILLLILVLALSIIAIRISFKFDINDYLKNRRKIKLDQLKNMCTHGKMELEGKRVSFTSYFSSPSGTVNWFCSRCGLVVGSEDDVNRLSKQYLENPDRYIANEKKFVKQAKKLKLF